MLLSKVAKNPRTGCWEWTAYKNQDGYGRARFDGRLEMAHRISFQVWRGNIPDGMRVLHKCDNPSCINPDHLFLGTQAENVADMIAKGRKVVLTGQQHGSAKLTESDVLAIRSDKTTRSSVLGAIYGVDRTRIWSIRTGKTWKGAGNGSN